MPLIPLESAGNRVRIALMKVRIFGIFSLVLLPASWLPAQQNQIAGPVSGYVFDQAARGLRPILGIPGASLVGEPMDFGFQVAAAYVAPSQDAAFVAGADGTFHLFRIGTGGTAEQVVNGLGAAPQRVVFSPSGKAAALFGAGSVQIVGGLPDSPAITGAFDVSAAGAPDSLAVSDDGALLLLASGTSVELFSAGGDLGPLTATAGPAITAFARASHDAAILDPTGAGLVLFRDLTGASTSQVVAPPYDAVQSATALAFAADGKRLLIASASLQSVTSFDPATGDRSAIACNCAPTSLVQVGSLFRLNELNRDPLWLLDARADAPSIVFVPAVAVTQPVRDIRVPRGRPTKPGRVFLEE